MGRRFNIVMLMLACLLGCHNKVELGRIQTEASVFQAYWFEREATLYVFYNIRTTERIRDTSAFEYSLDAQPWVLVSEAPLVQVHQPLDCGADRRCGSFSLAVSSPPETLALRLRFQSEGTLSDQFQKTPLIIRKSEIAPDRSFYVYGFFDASNQFVSWQGRNAFPGLSHEEVVSFGLRRPYTVEGSKAHVTTTPISLVNPSLYGANEPCAGEELSRSLFASTQGEDIWSLEPVPTRAEEVCTNAESRDALGSLVKSALARKNPVVTSLGFDLALRFTDSLKLSFVLASCDNPDADYLRFQIDRLKIDHSEVDLCIESSNFNVNGLRQLFLARIAAARASSNKNLALLIVLHYRDPSAAERISSILGKTLDQVLDESQNPRIAAALVYDSFPLTESLLPSRSQLVWCPTLNSSDATLNSCIFTPTKIVLGPVEIKSSPALPDYPSYQKLDNDQKNGVTVERIEVLTPAGTNDQDKVDIVRNETGFWIFHPNDTLTLGKDEAYSYCGKNDGTSSLAFRTIDTNPLGYGEPELLSALPVKHNLQPSDRTVQLGLVTELPFFLSLSYRSRIAIGPKSLTGILSIKRNVSMTDTLGDLVLTQAKVPVRDVLARCTQYCQNPAFDESGVYLLSRPWDIEFATRCYEPQIPTPGGL